MSGEFDLALRHSYAKLLKVISFTEGQSEDKNEDAILVQPLSGDSAGWIGAVADGQGGQAGGAKAAQLACLSLVNAASEIAHASFRQPNVWWDFFRDSDHVVNKDQEAGYTTLVAFAVLNGYIYGASCGDGAAYLCNSKAHLIELTASQHKNPQIGSGMTSCAYFSSPLVKPWSLLIMTDGVWKYVGWEKISHLLKNKTGSELGSELEAAGRLPGSGRFSDDFTYVLIED